MKKERIVSFMFLLPFLMIALGCATVISKEIRDEASTLRMVEVRGDPQAYQGQAVIWAGVIIATTNLKDETVIEILHKPSDLQGKPKDVDLTQGRFLAVSKGYLDAAVYTQGRQVTVAGEITGTRVLLVGEYEYTYPVISMKEIHLWPVEKDVQYYYYPTYRPWYWYHPNYW